MATAQEEQPRLYRDLARWWPLFSPPSEYVEEADWFLPVLLKATDPAPRTLLELGAGGGSLAFHLKSRFTLTLTDLSPEMLEVSRVVNPECEHLQGDMRSLDLGRQFDLVFIHDAIMYATDPESVRATLATANRHCRPGGAILVAPDHVQETFESGTDWGGEDAPDGSGLRWLEWTWDPDPDDNTFVAAYSLVFREPDGQLHFEGDRHLCGLFPRQSWLDWMTAEGLETTTTLDPWRRDILLGRKPA